MDSMEFKRFKRKYNPPKRCKNGVCDMKCGTVEKVEQWWSEKDAAPERATAGENKNSV
jgi:hypothetical protein